HMLIEMHSHTSEHSGCSVVAAADLLRQVHARRLDGIVLTDHHYLWSAAELAELVARAGVPLTFPVMAAQEVTTPELGDLLVYGADRSIAAGTPLAEIRERWPEAALVWAHPYRNGAVPQAEQLRHPLLDGVEIINSNQTARENRKGLEDWHLLRFTALGGSDTHAAGYAGIYPTQFLHPVRDVHELAREVRAGRCRPYLKEISRYGENTTVTEVTFGISGPSGSSPLIVKTAEKPEKWRAAHRAYRIMREIHAAGFDGGTYRIPRPVDEDLAAHAVIEESVQGRSLHELLAEGGPEDRLLRLAGGWLARLHAARLVVTPPGMFLPVEEKRLARYVEYFREARHRHTPKAAALCGQLAEEERLLVEEGRPLMVQGHGDFHPKNLILGSDGGEYIAAIDFDSSYAQPRAFDVGYFLTQLRNQLPAEEGVWRRRRGVFLEAYLAGCGVLEEDFAAQVELFRARTGANIASFLVWIGQGESPEVWRILVEAEQSLAVWQAARRR
ncbi:MAG TPA: phosphotransferase, partial [Verrucomicrobiae bacterium]|nr:phosphotransferase [Verrucomicrobiae bacterium]